MSTRRRSLQPWLLRVLILAAVAVVAIDIGDGSAGIGAGGSGGGLVGGLARFLDTAPEFPAFFLYVIVAAIPVVLVHELGHALAARYLLVRSPRSPAWSRRR